MSWSRGSFASWSIIPSPWMAKWFGTQQKWTQVSLSLSAQRRFMIWQMRGFSVISFSIACKQNSASPRRLQYHAVHGPFGDYSEAVASAAKMVLISANLFDNWLKVVTPLWEWWWMTAAAPTLSLSYICQLRLHHVVLEHRDTHWILAWASSLLIMHLPTHSMRLCLIKSIKFQAEKLMSSGGIPFLNQSLQRS